MCFAGQLLRQCQVLLTMPNSQRHVVWTSVVDCMPCHAEPFIKLGRQMSLPQTACLALPGPLGPVPGTTFGRAWYSEDDEDNTDSTV